MEVMNSILLILPVRSFCLGAEPALEPIFHLVQEPGMCLRGGTHGRGPQRWFRPQIEYG